MIYICKFIFTHVHYIYTYIDYIIVSNIVKYVLLVIRNIYY